MITIKKTINLLLENKALVLILLTATILRFYHLDFQSLWMDEIYTLNVADSKHTFSQIISEVNLRESYPYLYFFIMNTLFSLFGDTSIVARIASAIFGTLAVLMIYKLGKELYSKNVGLIAALLLSFNQFAIFHSQEVRAYSFYLLGLLFSYYCFIKFIKEDNNKNMLLYAFSTGLLLNTNFFSVLNILSQGLFMVFVLISLDKNERNSYLKKMLIITSIALLFFLPNAYKFYLLTNLIVLWIPKASDEAFVSVLKEILGSSIYLIFIYSTLFTFFMVKVFSQKETRKLKEMLSKKLIFSYLIIFSWISFVLIIIIFKSYVGLSIFLSRYFMSILPAFILAISIALVRIKNIQIRLSFLVLLIFFMVFDLIVVKKYYKTIAKSQYREVSKFIIDNNKNNETVYTSLSYWYGYYLSNEKTKTNLIEKPLDDIVNEMVQDTTKIKEFWYADAHNSPYNPTDQTKKFLDTNFYVENNFDGYDAWTKHYILIKNAKTTIDISKYKNLKKQNGDLFNLNIESFKFQDNIITTSGWAFFGDQTSDQTDIKLILIKDIKNTKILQTQKVIRKDISEYFKSSFDYSNSGFTSSTHLESFQKGYYKLGVYLINKTSKKEGLILTDKFVVIN